MRVRLIDQRPRSRWLFVGPARCVMALGRLVAWWFAYRRYETQVERYDGLFGPWRWTRDQARGIGPPRRPPTPRALDFVLGAGGVAMLGLVALALSVVA